MNAPNRFRPGRGVRRQPGEMNKTERAYSLHLDGLIRRGEIVAWKFEGLTLKLAKDTRYTPDFLVQLNDDALECHEVKGFWRDDAKVKIKVAAAMYPFTFRAFRPMPKKSGGGWERETF